MSDQPAAGRVRVVVSRASLPGDPSARLAEHFDVDTWTHDAAPSSYELAALIGDAPALLAVAKDKIDAKLLAACPNLRSVAVASTGYDSVDIDAVTARGVRVTHTPAVLSEAVADHAIFLATAARRRAHEHVAMFRSGRWDHHLALDEMLGLDVHGSTLGLVGYGQVGKTIARRAAAYNMRILEYSKGPHDDLAEPHELDDLLVVSDIVVMCLPLFPDTHHLIGVRELALMKPTATLVNVGRGATLDQAALVDALRNGVIHSAGIDVFEHEPISDTSEAILGLPNAYVTPHMASATVAARAAMVTLAADDLRAMIEHREPKHLIAELRTRR